MAGYRVDRFPRLFFSLCVHNLGDAVVIKRRAVGEKWEKSGIVVGVLGEFSYCYPTHSTVVRIGFQPTERMQTRCNVALVVIKSTAPAV